MSNKSPASGKPIHALLQEAFALHQQQKTDAAQKLYRKILQLDQHNINALTLLGSLYLERGACAEAATLLRQSLSLHASQPVALCNLGLCLEKLGQAEAALASYNDAIRLQADFAGALYNRGALYRKQQHYEAALQDYQRVIELQPTFQRAHNNMGNVLTDLGRIADAITCFNTAIQLDPAHAEAFNNRGVCYWKLCRYPEAVADYRQALALNPDYFSAHLNLATTLYDLREYRAAEAHLQRALALQPDDAAAAALRLDIATQQCDWRDFQPMLEKLAADVVRGQAIKPFLVVTLLDNPALQQQAARQWTDTFYPARQQQATGVPSTTAIPPAQDQRIRLAYLSADFHAHATAFLMARVFELHDRSRFAVHGIAIGRQKADDMRARLANSFEHFVDASLWSDAAIVDYVRQHDIDILIDLKGHTRESRSGVLACHPGKIQAQYLGYPGTMGASYIDYIIADNTVLPAELQACFTEKAVILPGSYQCNDATRQIDEPPPTRSAVGLPDNGFVFCCFNQHYKFTPAVFAIWLRLLQAVPGSVLWLLVTDEAVASRLRAIAAEHHIDPARLCFAGFLPQAQHLSRIRLADLFLDTLPCNAHTTASDALWAGVPLLTCSGKSFCARVASSLLTAMGMEELITTNLADYEQRALTLAMDRPGLSAIREKLWQQRNRASLFDTQHFTRKLERAYLAMHHRANNRLPPTALYLDPD